MSGWRTQLTDGFARLLVAQVAGENLAWSTTGAYADDVTPIFDTVVPETPNRILTLGVYGLGDDPTQPMSDFGLQVRTRSTSQDPRNATDLDDAIADVLLGLFPTTLPGAGLRVAELERRSSTPLGQDDSRRWSFISNYAGSAYRPSTHRR